MKLSSEISWQEARAVGPGGRIACADGEFVVAAWSSAGPVQLVPLELAERQAAEAPPAGEAPTEAASPASPAADVKVAELIRALAASDRPALDRLEAWARDLQPTTSDTEEGAPS